MTHGDGRSPGFEWAGSLDEVALASVYARCAELRFSGRLLLYNIVGKASGDPVVVEFLGGDAVDAVTSTAWRSGHFQLVQALPDLSGALTEGLEMRGTLVATSPRELIRHCQTLRLSVDVFLQHRSGARALLRFAHGRVETAAVDGVPELGALARVERWTEGEFRLVLRPLFADDAPAPPPSVPPLKDVSGQDFDLSTRTRMPPLRSQDADGLGEDPPGPGRSLGSVALRAGDPARGASGSGELAQAAGGVVVAGAGPAGQWVGRRWIWMMTAAVAVLGLGALTWILTRHS
ncbi:MAG TPA: hypothetical protein VH877_16700 [Polyangia bacterium]|nr:hypothetical protein [Polyangia bacterium]